MDVIEIHTHTDYDVVPGTVYIVDQRHGAAFSKKDIILVPTPSASLQDPLRWRKSRKIYHLGLLVAYTALMGALTNWSSTIYVILTQAYETDLTGLNLGSALNLLMLGIGNIVLIPLANKYGRRPIYLVSLILVCLSQVWLALSTTVAHFQGAQVLLGIGAAPFEALVAISIADTYFVHERGTMLSYFVFGQGFGSYIGPICAGYMETSQGWQWVFWWGTIMTAFLVVLFFFTFDESNFLRMDESPNHITDPTCTDETDPPQFKTADEREDHKLQPVNSLPKAGEVFNCDKSTVQTSFYKTFPVPWSAVMSDLWTPVKVCAMPAVIWCGISYGTCVSWLTVMAITIAATFAPPPYLWSDNQLGLFWISPLIGSLIGAAFCGPINDWFIMQLSKRNRGWREPEFCLWSLIPTAIIMPAGLMIYGIAAARGLHWIIPVFGAGLIGFGISVSGTVATSYILDCYKNIDTQAITAVILIRNVVGFAITWATQPWIDNMGRQNAFIVVGILSLVITGFSVVFIGFGKAMRRFTASKYDSLSLRNKTL